VVFVCCVVWVLILFYYLLNIMMRSSPVFLRKKKKKKQLLDKLSTLEAWCSTEDASFGVILSKANESATRTQ
jgi:hypothetical protein